MNFIEKIFEDIMYRRKEYEYTPCGSFEVNEKVFHAYSRTHEDHEPHFHVYLENGKHFFKNVNKNHFHACISLIKPEYVDHGFKNGKFNSDELVAFCEFLKSKPSHLRGRNRWEFIVTLWDPNDIQNDIYVDDIAMPDYTKLP